MSNTTTGFKPTMLAKALMLAFAATVSTGALAQSNTTGNIYGTVEAQAGTTVVVEGAGIRRTLTPDATGRFQALSLPVGEYKVSLVRNGKVERTEDVVVSIGQGSAVSFAPARVEVTGRVSRIDVTNTNNGATFTARELARLPIANNVDAIIQLAPNTTYADPRYSGGASFGGSGPSENSYYINGFPVTNPLTQLGASELPFGAIGQAQILTGGFGAEFGRSIGGVVNVTTKSGTNNWEVGGVVSISPSGLRSKYRDIYYPRTGDPANAGTDNTLFRRREDNKRSELRYGAYVGGPIIEDKLYMFVAAETNRVDRDGVAARFNTGSSTASLSRWGWEESDDETTRWLGKFDWNLTENHRIEATLIGDTTKTDSKLYGYNYATRERNYVLGSSEHYKNVPNVTPNVGANVQILRYQGNLTDDLTLTALYGQMQSKHSNTFDGYDVYDPANARFQVVTSPAVQAPGLTYLNAQPLTGNILAKDAEDNVKSFRLDLEYKLGRHTIRAGIDENKLESLNAGQIRAGGGEWRYFKTATPNTPISMSIGPRVATASGGGLGTQGYYVRRRIFNSATSVYSNQSAQYIEDRFQVTKDILVTAGIRNESFENLNGDKQVFLEMKNQIAPRLSASWDVYGDASLKVFGSTGRYYIQLPTQVGVRGASRSTFTDQFFTYTGVDPVTGAPTGLVALTGVRSNNNEFGQPKDPKTVSALDMKPNYQDELTVGFEKAWSQDFNFGARVTYRRLGAAIDDVCDQRPFDAWAARNNVSTANWDGFHCASFNPGKDNTFLVDFAGTGTNHTRVHLTAAELGFEKAERTYRAVDLFAEHPLRKGWYGRIGYTWSRAHGNTEGQTLSDVAQTDVAATQTWDYPEIMEYAKGLLPSHRKHQIKAYGFYELTPEWSIAGNLLAASGRPKNCIGNYPDALLTDDNPNYGSAHHYCNQVPSPRGTAGELPWDIRLDMNVVYKPAALKGLSLKMDVFNVTNRQTVQAIDEVYNLQTQVSPTYGRPIGFTAPRAVKFSVEYNHKF